MAPSPSGDDDSDVSVSSSIIEDADADAHYNVEGIVAELDIEFDGEPRTHCLVHWQGYEMHDWTWEPLDNLQSDSPQVLGAWEALKASNAAGTTKPFSVSHWKRAKKKHLRERLARSVRRQRKRRRLGLDLSWTENSLRRQIAEIDYFPSDGDDDDDDGGDGDGATFEPHPVPTDRRPQSPPKPASTEPGPGVVVPVPASRPKLAANAAPKGRKSAGVTKPSDRHSLPGKSHIARPVIRAGPSVGSHSKPPMKATESPISPAGKGNEVSTTTNNNPPTLTGSDIRRSSMSGSGAVNVFAGGKEPRKRRPFAVNDASKDGKLFAKVSHRRAVEKRIRDVEGYGAPIGPGLLHCAADSREVREIRNPSPDLDVARHSADNDNPDATLARPAQHSQRNQNGHTGQGGPPGATRAGEPPKPPRRKSVRFDDEPATVVFVDAPSFGDEADGDSCSELFVPLNRDRNGSVELTQSSTDYEDVVPKLISFGPRPSTLINCAFKRRAGHGDQSWPAPFLESTCVTFTHRFHLSSLQRQLPDLSSRFVSQGDCRELHARDAETLRLVMDRLQLGFAATAFEGECTIMVWVSDANGQDSSAGSTLSFAVMEGRPAVDLPVKPPSAGHEAFSSTWETAMRRTTNLKYSSSDPDGLPDHENFFFILCNREVGPGQVVVRFLEQRNPNCTISLSMASGAWANFLSQDSGTVIVTETSLDMIRLLPRVFKILQLPSSRFSFRILKYSSSLLPAVSQFGLLTTEAIFPHGDVILLTPSFLLSDPRGAVDLVTRFRQRWSNEKALWKLVVSAEIVNHLLELIHNEKGLGTQPLGERRGAESADLPHRIELWRIMVQLDNESQPDLPPFDIEDPNRPLIFADERIDPNDEQSLLNWFGTWSLRNIAHFRRFHVVGSEESARGVWREIAVPRFPATVQYDPDFIGLSTMPAATGVDISQIAEKLADIKDVMATKAFCPLLLFNKPIGYSGIKVKDALGETRSTAMETYKEWFALFDASKIRSKNTLGGLFHTPAVSTSNLPPLADGSSVPRHTWLAFFRPIMIPWTKKDFELIIWDASNRGRAVLPEGEHSTVPASELLESQQELIQFMQREVPKRMEGSQLERAWIGCLQAPGEQAGGAFESCLDFLRAAVDDPRYFLPLGDRNLKPRGYRLLELQGGQANEQGQGSPPAGKAKTGGSGPERVVFHPPRGEATGRSRCRNRLLQQSRAAYGNGVNKFRFTFRPTAEWYAGQQEEGRQFEHINVDTIDYMMKVLG